MAETGHKGIGRLRTIFVLVLVAAVATLLLMEAWPQIVDTARSGAGTDGRITATLSSTPVPTTSGTTEGDE